MSTRFYQTVLLGRKKTTHGLIKLTIDPDGAGGRGDTKTKKSMKTEVIKNTIRKPM